MRRVAVFDFDGTITREDTLIAFIRFVKGSLGLYWGMFAHLPWLLLMKLRLCDNGKTKERVFGWFFSGMSIEQFNKLGQQFYEAQADNLLYADAVQAIKEHNQKGDKVVVVSASIENWILPFASALQADGLLGTQAEVQNGRLTGKFSTKNCYGREKVERLKQWLQENGIKDSYVIAYGDSRGDKELLDFANEKHYKSFKQ